MRMINRSHPYFPAKRIHKFSSVPDILDRRFTPRNNSTKKIDEVSYPCQKSFCGIIRYDLMKNWSTGPKRTRTSKKNNCQDTTYRNIHHTWVGEGKVLTKSNATSIFLFFGAKMIPPWALVLFYSWYGMVCTSQPIFSPPKKIWQD